jgi:hypothetical protein
MPLKTQVLLATLLNIHAGLQLMNAQNSFKALLSARIQQIESKHHRLSENTIPQPSHHCPTLCPKHLQLRAIHREPLMAAESLLT